MPPPPDTVFQLEKLYPVLVYPFDATVKFKHPDVELVVPEPPLALYDIV